MHLESPLPRRLPDPVHRDLDDARGVRRHPVHRGLRVMVDEPRSPNRAAGLGTGSSLPQRAAAVARRYMLELVAQKGNGRKHPAVSGVPLEGAPRFDESIPERQSRVYVARIHASIRLALPRLPEWTIWSNTRR